MVTESNIARARVVEAGARPLYSDSMETRHSFPDRPANAAVARLALALVVSLALHGAVIFAVRIGQIERPGQVSSRLQVRLADVERAPAPEEQQPVLLRAIDAPSPKPLAEPPPEPAPLPTQATAPTPTPTPATEAKTTAPTEAKAGMPEQAAGATTVDMPLPADPTYYPASQVDEHPSLVSGGKPVYPSKADAAHVRGKVTVLILLDEHGGVDEASIVEARPEGMGFEESVLAWLHNARFKPAMRGGRAVKARVVYRVTFDL
jgi:protein TonB